MSFGPRFLKSLSQNWWVLYWIVAIILFFFDIQWGILALVVFVAIVVFQIFLKRRKKASISRNLLGIEKIDERSLARLAGAYIEETHAFLHDVSRNPDSTGIAILVKGEYIYFSNAVVKKFKQLYKEGKNTKELLEEMPQFETREEVKKMLEKLKEFDELPSRKKEGEEEKGPEEASADESEVQPAKKGPARWTHPALGIVIAIIAVVTLLAASVSLNNGTLETVTDYAAYHAWLEEISNATGYGMLVLLVALVFSLASRRKVMAIALCGSALIALAIVLYINDFRPYSDVVPFGSAEEALQAFKGLVGTLEALAITAAALGVVVELYRLKTHSR
ncbi:MAG: hypothetical protein JW839_09235 [Candidatus Lokiarchaeota archaeon]|nr:hypothetical protein [Candidatus Lokiarchaeota archaeon]